MKRKNLHSGLVVQIFVLLLFIPALIIISRAEPKKTTTASTFGLAELAADNQPGKSFSPGEDSKYALAESSLPSPAEGPGGPILIISSSDNPFSRYAVEIMRAEGLNEFATEDISTVTSTLLNNHDVVILGEMTLDQMQVNMLAKWVNEGGTLISFKPCSLLLPLLGLSPANGTMNDKYLLVNTASDAGAGIVNETMQFHGSANLHELNGATSLATLYSTSTMATLNPAVTTINAGMGKAIAFTYDLARSVVYTRQGNPNWAGQKRDGEIDPIRSDDLFYPDWLDFDKIAIPQADEQQRLLANIIVLSNLHRKPLPRFWYLPRDLKAAIVMTGDNHTTNGTTGRFYQYLTLGPNSAQDVADWKAVRATSYIYPDMPITIEQAVFFQEQGFEISLHTNTGCSDYTPTSLKRDFTEELRRFSLSYPGVTSPVTNRSHCLNWSDWSSTPEVELKNGIRLDATYYYWPESWMRNRPGMFTGSGIPMRFADMDGSLIDVYQMPTQITDETNMDYSSFCNALLDKAIGPEGFYGVFCANMHTDHKYSEGSDAIIASAQARGIPVISAKQMLCWLDGRNNSSFSNMTWQNNQLSFSVVAQNNAHNLRAMLPLYSGDSRLATITSNDQPVSFTTAVIKGIEYAFFSPDAGNHSYIANYSAKKKDKKDIGKSLALQKNHTRQEDVTPKSTLYLNVMPNPGIGYFNLVLNSHDANPVSIKITDGTGKLIETHDKVSAGGILRLGEQWKSGIYFAEVMQGNKKEITRIVKLN